MLKYLPFVVVGIIVVPLTLWQWKLMDWVWTDNIPAMQCAYLLETEIPRTVGDWEGEDRPVDAKVLETAGADGYIDRVYTNTKTGEQVSIWLIVGHFRHVSRHTPNVCYRVAGFEQLGDAVPYRIDVPGIPTSEFRTAKFSKAAGNSIFYQRVFWGWWKPEPLEEGQSADDVNIAWASPEDPRLHFGYCRALYKLYFTAGTSEEETPDQSVCLKFATEFLPIVHDRLRESGLVMAKEELPEDAEDVLKRMRSVNEGKAEDGDETEQDTAENEEQTPAGDETGDTAEAA